MNACVTYLEVSADEEEVDLEALLALGLGYRRVDRIQLAMTAALNRNLITTNTAADQYCRQGDRIRLGLTCMLGRAREGR